MYKKAKETADTMNNPSSAQFNETIQVSAVEYVKFNDGGGQDPD